MFYVIHSELLKFSVEMEFLEFSSKEAAAPLMSVAAPLYFWKIQSFFFLKNENYGEF